MSLFGRNEPLRTDREIITCKRGRASGRGLGFAPTHRVLEKPEGEHHPEKDGILGLGNLDFQTLEILGILPGEARLIERIPGQDPETHLPAIPDVKQVEHTSLLEGGEDPGFRQVIVGRRERGSPCRLEAREPVIIWGTAFSSKARTTFANSSDCGIYPVALETGPLIPARGGRENAFLTRF